MAIEITVSLVIGYVASIYTWPHVRAWLVGVETEIRSLEDRAKALKDALRGKL